MKTVVGQQATLRKRLQWKLLKHWRCGTGTGIYVRHCSQLKKWTEGNGGSRKKLAAAQGRLTCCAIPVWRKGSHQRPGKVNVVRETQKEWMFGKRRWAKPECNNGTRNQGLNEQLRLGSERTSGQKTKKWTFTQDSEKECQDTVEGSTPSEMKEVTANNRLRDRDVGALTTLETVALNDQ
jgi:hypothetical protein